MHVHHLRKKDIFRKTIYPYTKYPRIHTYTILCKDIIYAHAQYAQDIFRCLRPDIHNVPYICNIIILRQQTQHIQHHFHIQHTQRTYSYTTYLTQQNPTYTTYLYRYSRPYKHYTTYEYNIPKIYTRTYIHIQHPQHHKRIQHTQHIYTRTTPPP